MGATVRIKPMAQTFTVSGARDGSLVAGFHRVQVAAAERIDAEITGKVPGSTTFVNGARSDALETVRPGQAIVTVFELAHEGLQWILDLLIVAAPYRTGAFKKSIRMFADGREIEDVKDAAGADEVTFTSVAPYARKIERGESDQAPDGLFESVAAMAARRFGNQMAIKFTFANPVGDEATALAQWAGRRGEGRSRRQHQRDTRQPAVVVRFR